MPAVNKRFADINWTENAQTKQCQLLTSFMNELWWKCSKFAELFSYTRLFSNLNPTTCKCVYLVTRGHFRSRDKDGGHTIRSAIAENSMLHANLIGRSKFYMYIAGIWSFDFFAP